MSTWPPPKLTAYRPFLTDAMISAGSRSPFTVMVLVMRGIGMCANDTAPAIAGGRNTHQPRVRASSCSLQDAILDEYGTLRRVAFVVDVERTPPGWQYHIDSRDTLRGETRNLPANAGRALAIEVAFEPVADCFVQSIPATRVRAPPSWCPPAHRWRRGSATPDPPARSAYSLQDRVGEIAVLDPPASATHALLAAAVFFDDHRDRQAPSGRTSAAMRPSLRAVDRPRIHRPATP